MNFRILKSSITTGILLITAIILSGCLENGAAGPAGPAGEDGINGNANVQVRTVTPPSGNTFFSWTEDTFLGQPANRVSISDTIFTQNRINTDFISVDIQFDSNIWYPLPLTLDSDAVITFTTQVDTLKVYSFQQDSAYDASISRIRYFIIESNNSE